MVNTQNGGHDVPFSKILLFPLRVCFDSACLTSLSIFSLSSLLFSSFLFFSFPFLSCD